MKKFLLTAALCLPLCLFSACDVGELSETDGYAMLNDMLGAVYSQITLTVTDTFDEETFLKSEYVITYTDGAANVRYRVERFAELGGETETEDIKTVLTGQAVMKDGKLQPVEGDAPDVSPNFTGGLAFKAEYFENADLGEVYLQADVKDPAAFLGDPALSCDDMHVEAVFLDLFISIEIVYTAEDGSRVECVYEFLR